MQMNMNFKIITGVNCFLVTVNNKKEVKTVYQAVIFKKTKKKQRKKDIQQQPREPNYAKMLQKTLKCSQPNEPFHCSNSGLDIR